MEASDPRAGLRVVLAAAMSLVVLAGCGGDDDVTTPGATAGAGAPPASSGDSATGPVVSGSADSGPGGCPTGAAVSAAYGLEMEFNTDFSITEDWLVEEMGGATCQYNQVLAPDATDPSGLDAVAYIATIELMHSDPIADAVGAESVDGVGDAAVWNGAQLSVRAGERGVRVTNQYPPPGQDGRAVAIALAELALATEWSAGSPSTAATVEPSETGGPSAGGPTDCPAADAVSGVWGAEVALDDESAMTGAIGLVFCPYEEVIAPGTTDQWGSEPLGDFFSITFTDHNLGDPELTGGDPVEGVGEQAAWDGSQLSVWTGTRGIIVDVTFPPEGRDALDVAAALAGLALGIDVGEAAVVPGSATPSGDATACAAPSDIAAALGLEAQLELGPGASTDTGTPGDYSLYCPYQLVSDPFSFGLVVSVQAELLPIDPEAPSEDLTDHFGMPATWQDEFSVLLIEQPDVDFVVQITSNELDIDSREAAIAIAEELL